jgi:proline dehydrogenase
MQFYEKSIYFLDKKLIDCIEQLRTYFNTIFTFNTWFTGGDINNAGFIIDNIIKDQRSYGRGVNIYFPKGTNYDVLRETIRNKYDTFRKMGITTIKPDTKDYLYIDVRWTNMDKLPEIN